MALGQEEVGRKIRQARDDAGMTQPELAARIGLRHPQSVSNYERGLTDVPPARLRRIADETGKPISYFLGDGAQPQDQTLREMIRETVIEVLETEQFPRLRGLADAAERMEKALGRLEEGQAARVAQRSPRKPRSAS